MKDAVGAVEDDSLERFCTVQHVRLVGMLDLLVGNLAVAEELAQEALARAWMSWWRVRRYDNPEAWLHRVAVNLAMSHFRRRAAERRATARLDDPADAVEDTDVASAVALRAALARLPERMRTAVVLRFYVDLPYAEVASRMRLAEPTCRSFVNRALERLRHDLQAIPEEATDAL